MSKIRFFFIFVWIGLSACRALDGGEGTSEQETVVENIAEEIVVTEEGTMVSLLPKLVFNKRHLSSALRQLGEAPSSPDARKNLYGITNEEIVTGETLENFAVEASVPFSDAKTCEIFRWVSFAQNKGRRNRSAQTIEEKKSTLNNLANDPKYDVQSSADLVAWVKKKNANNRDIQLRVFSTSASDPAYQELRELLPSIIDVHRQAFSSHWQGTSESVLASFMDSSADNLLAVAKSASTNKALAITALRVTTFDKKTSPGSEKINVGEISLSASLPDTNGLNALLKRLLLQKTSARSVPLQFIYSMSRVSKSLAVLKANRRAGLKLDPSVLFVAKTMVTSDLDPGDPIRIVTSKGTELEVDDLALTYLTWADLPALLQNYGTVPLDAAGYLQ